MFRDVNHALNSEATPCCVASLDIGHPLHMASNIRKNDVRTHSGSFAWNCQFQKLFLFELQQRISGMPNSMII
jgi:hypothetical protein